jgi:PAS domain-containing protein
MAGGSLATFILAFGQTIERGVEVRHSLHGREFGDNRGGGDEGKTHPISSGRRCLGSKSGNLFPLDDSVAPIRLRTGDVVGAVIVFRDATKRRRAEAARIEAETRYREIFENAVVGMFQSTPDGRYLRVNQAMAAMTSPGPI